MILVLKYVFPCEWRLSFCSCDYILLKRTICRTLTSLLNNTKMWCWWTDRLTAITFIFNYKLRDNTHIDLIWKLLSRIRFSLTWCVYVRVCARIHTLHEVKLKYTTSLRTSVKHSHCINTTKLYFTLYKRSKAVFPTTITL